MIVRGLFHTLLKSFTQLNDAHHTAIQICQQYRSCKILRNNDEYNRKIRQEFPTVCTDNSQSDKYSKIWKKKMIGTEFIEIKIQLLKCDRDSLLWFLSSKKLHSKDERF
uniref:Uncharacterized protein n=1 Tax=Onchocerca volvulus TaxID=6282 RepID=A0A8R1Y0U9_ONCVO